MDDDVSQGEGAGERTARTAAGGHRKRHPDRKIFLGSDLMNEKFRKLRQLSSFECREKSFLKDFKKRIRDSYFNN